jgi:hypothetical protein
MKPSPTLNTSGVQFALQEPRDNTPRAGLRDKGLNRVGLEIFPKINKDNPGKEVGIDAKCVRGLEVISGVNTNPCQHYAIQIKTQVKMRQCV